LYNQKAAKSRKSVI